MGMKCTSAYLSCLEPRAGVGGHTVPAGLCRHTGHGGQCLFSKSMGALWGMRKTTTMQERFR